MGLCKSNVVPLIHCSVILGGSWIIWSNLGFQDRYPSGLAAISRDPETQRRGPLTLKELSKCLTLTGFLSLIRTNDYNSYIMTFLKILLHSHDNFSLFHRRETSYWSLLENPPKETEISFVIAEKSDRWDEDTTKRLATIAKQRQNVSEGKVATHLLRNSGHWVHTDNPKGLLEIVSPNFLSTHK